MKNHYFVVTSKGGSDKLKFVETEIPEPGFGEVRVKILAAGVSSADVLMREAIYPAGQPSFPFTPGYDIVGVIDKCGEGVERFDTDQRVAALTKVGGYAEFICVSEKDLVALPPDVDPVEAVALILNYITAYQTIHRVTEAKAGEKALVYAAAGGLGTALLELGRLAGLQVYGTASSKKHEIVSKLGATPIDYKNEDVVKKIYSLTGDGVDIIFDPIGGENCFRAYPALRENGRLITFGASYALNGNSPTPDLLEINAWWRASLALDLISESKKVLTYAANYFKQDHHDWYLEDLSTILNLLAQKKIKPVIALTLPLSEAVKAHELLDNQAVSGKIVLVP